MPPGRLRLKDERSKGVLEMHNLMINANDVYLGLKIINLQISL